MSIISLAGVRLQNILPVNFCRSQTESWPGPSAAPPAPRPSGAELGARARPAPETGGRLPLGTLQRPGGRQQRTPLLRGQGPLWCPSKALGGCPARGRFAASGSAPLQPDPGSQGQTGGGYGRMGLCSRVRRGPQSVSLSSSEPAQVAPNPIPGLAPPGQIHDVLAQPHHHGRLASADVPVWHHRRRLQLLQPGHGPVVVLVGFDPQAASGLEGFRGCRGGR